MSDYTGFPNKATILKAHARQSTVSRVQINFMFLKETTSRSRRSFDLHLSKQGAVMLHLQFYQTTMLLHKKDSSSRLPPSLWLELHCSASAARNVATAEVSLTSRKVTFRDYCLVPRLPPTRYLLNPSSNTPWYEYYLCNQHDS